MPQELVRTIVKKFSKRYQGSETPWQGKLKSFQTPAASISGDLC